MWRHNDDAIFVATIQVFNMHFYIYAFERACQGEMKPGKIVDVVKIKWDMAFLILKNASAKCGVPHWETSPNLSHIFVPANSAMLHMWCTRWQN